MDRYKVFPSGELGMSPTGNWTPYADAQATVEALQAQLVTLKRHAGLDCGDQSCLYALEHSGMRTNGGCRCSPKRMKDDLERSRKAAEALQRERDEFERERDQLHAALMEAITAHRNMVKQFDELTCFIGCDYDPETETWVSGEPPYLSAGTNEVEACKAAVDALRSVAIVLQAALDAEREKVKGLESEGVKLFEWRLALHSLTPGGSEFCTPDACEQWVRKSRTSQHEYIIEQIKQRKGPQTQLSQLQALVRALPVVSEVTSDTVVNLVQQYSFHAWILRALQLRATLDTTPPAPMDAAETHDRMFNHADRHPEAL